MEFWLWAVICFLIVVIAVLTVKIYLLRKSAREIEEGLSEKLTSDTNTLIGISSNDRCMRRLASSINTQLRTLRAQRHRFRQGDSELKNAVTNISHDLRTPLTAICGYLDLLEREEKTETVERYIGIIRNRTELLKKLTEELFRYSVVIAAGDDPVREPVVINHVLEESIATFYPLLKGRGITPDIRMPKEKLVRCLDRAALSRVFSNLLDNIIKYSDGNLDITLSDSGEITFSNTATGLSKVQAGRLFDRFYTVEAAHSSTGLGLAIARTLVEKMGGSIYAEYEGSCLEIVIVFPEES